MERIVIVDRNIYVYLFVRNGMHSEQRALIFAESDYPKYLSDRALELLQRRSDLPIFILHVATTEGSRWPIGGVAARST